MLPLYLSTKFPHEYRDTLNRLLNRSADLSELFIVSAQGDPWIHFSITENKKVVSTQALNEGLAQPYFAWPLTAIDILSVHQLSFFMMVTLMFYQPIELAGGAKGCCVGESLMMLSVTWFNVVAYL